MHFVNQLEFDISNKELIHTYLILEGNQIQKSLTRIRFSSARKMTFESTLVSADTKKIS